MHGLINLYQPTLEMAGKFFERFLWDDFKTQPPVDQRFVPVSFVRNNNNHPKLEGTAGWGWVLKSPPNAFCFLCIKHVYIILVTGCDKFSVWLPMAIENSLGQLKVQGTLPRWAIKIIAENRVWTEILPWFLTFYQMCMTFHFPKRGCYKVLQAIFQQHQILGSKVLCNWAIDSQCQVAPWGYLLRKICRSLTSNP